MKHVIAFVNDHKLVEVTHALHGVEGLTGMTASSVRGFGRTGHRRGGRNITQELELLDQSTRIDVFCSDDHLEAVIETIRDAARTGRRGDGKVYVESVEDALRIETGARGPEAI